MSAFNQEQRARLNPHGKSVTDVMVDGCGIERRWLRLNAPRGAGLWSSWECWAALVMFGLGIGLLVLGSIRVFR